MTEKKNCEYTGGVIAVLEKRLLKERIVRMCGMSIDEAFRMLLDSGFGGGEATSSDDVEELVKRDERALDAFIREYAPSDDALVYLLSPRDFHNAKAIVKAKRLASDETSMLGGEGLYPVALLKEKIEAGDFAALGKELGGAVKEAETLLKEELPDGAKVGLAFEKARCAYFGRVLKKFGVERRLHARRVDMTNLLTAFRARDEKSAKPFYLPCGTLTERELSAAFTDDDRAMQAFEGTEYREFVRSLINARAQGRPYTQAERALASLELNYFSEKPYELSGKGNFLYYVLRRRAENENVRIVFVCLNAGLDEREIISRLRGVQ